MVNTSPSNKGCTYLFYFGFFSLLIFSRPIVLKATVIGITILLNLRMQCPSS